MTNANQHIEDYITSYFRLEKEPGYAILLKGKWGTGKTWFIKKTLSKFEDQETKKDKYLYVSLYGMTSFDEIDNEFFKQLHPILSSKTMDVVGKVARGLLKASLKVDLDTHESVTLSPQLPNFELPDFLKDTSQFLIIFDDLERASIPLESLMGYINHFVEQQGRKVIILANEDEIYSKAIKEKSKEVEDDVLTPDKENKATNYLRIKEKLIGKTFEVKPEVEDAINNFIKETTGITVKRYYSDNIGLILKTYNESEYKNLRHLKQSLWDFEFLLSHFNSTYVKKTILLNHLLKIFLILSFEIKSGNLNVHDIPNFADLNILIYRAQMNEDVSKETILKIYQRYPDVDWNNFIFDYSTWIEILDSSIFNENKINQAINDSCYIKSEETPNWKVAYFARDVTQKELDKALKGIELEIQSHAIKQVGVVLHIVGIYLWLQDEEIISKTKPDIVREACNYIDTMNDGDLRDWNTIEFSINRQSEAWGNLGFLARETEEFKAVMHHVVEKANEELVRTYPARAGKLIELMKNDAKQFYRSLVLNTNSDSEFYNLPILIHITPQYFIESLMETPERMWKYISWTFSNRYKDLGSKSLQIEATFVKEVFEILELILEFQKKKLLGLQIRDLITKGIAPGLEHLN